MSRFIQLHLLTSFPPANLNRDDLGRPKTAMMGGVPRLRVSSQSLKRAWRKSDVFENALKGHVGTRTKSMGVTIFKRLIAQGISEKKASEWTKKIAGLFGKLRTPTESDLKKIESKLREKGKSDEEISELIKLIPFEIQQLAHFSPEEETAIDELITTLAERGSEPEADELKLLRKQHTAADIALFGRMLASSPAFNTEAA